MKNFKAKSGFGRNPDDDLLIEAQAPIDGGGFRPVIFRRSRIDYLFGFNDEISGLTLDDGVTIPVAMPLAHLKQKVFQPDEDTDNGLDLMAVTGDVVNEVARVRLSRQFNPAAEMQEAKEEKPLEIVAHVHAKKADRQFKRVRFSEKNISFYEPHVERPEKEIWVQLKDGYTAGGFTGFYVPLSLSNFLWYLDSAKKEGRASLDLSEVTRPKTSTEFKLD